MAAFDYRLLELHMNPSFRFLTGKRQIDDESLKFLKKLDIKVRRNYRTVRIDVLTAEIFRNHRQKICDILSSISDRVDRLIFSYCELTELDYVTIISQFGKLADLNFFDAEVCDSDTATLPHLSLWNLIRFHVSFYKPVPGNESRTKMLQMLCHILTESHVLETAEFHETMIPNADDPDPFSKLREIIFRQQSLHRLDIKDSKFFNQYSSDPQFQLKTFKMLTDKFRFNHEQTQNLTAFLRSQKDVCVLDCDIARTLQIPTVRRVDDNWFNPENDGADVGQFREEFGSMKPNPYIQIYSADLGNLDDEDDAEEMIKTIVLKYPNIQELDLIYGIGDAESRGRDNLLVPLNKLTSLKKLELYCFYTTFHQVSRLKIPTLKSIEVRCSADNNFEEGGDFESLNRFVAKHAELEEFLMELDFSEDPEHESTGILLFLEFCLIVLEKLKLFKFTLVGLEKDVTMSDEFRRIVDENAKPGFKFTLSYEDGQAAVFEKS